MIYVASLFFSSTSVSISSSTKFGIPDAEINPKFNRLIELATVPDEGSKSNLSDIIWFAVAWIGVCHWDLAQFAVYLWYPYVSEQNNWLFQVAFVCQFALLFSSELLV